MERQKHKKHEILTNPERCTGCFRCALMCSLKLEKAFNPGYARIRIVPGDRSTVIGMPEISFTDNCKACGICVSACPWGALRISKTRKA